MTRAARIPHARRCGKKCASRNSHVGVRVDGLLRAQIVVKMLAHRDEYKRGHFARRIARQWRSDGRVWQQAGAAGC
jgi:hypothetical protein